jgi:hypothetical protein
MIAKYGLIVSSCLAGYGRARNGAELDGPPSVHEGIVVPHKTAGSTRNLTRSVAAALWGLRAYWGTGAVLAGAAATALIALLPVTSLSAWGPTGFATRLGLPAWRGGDLGMTWRTIAWTPNDARVAALGTLFQLLLGVAIGVLGVASLTMLSLSVARASPPPRPR